jgi:hypothetical protein
MAHPLHGTPRVQLSPSQLGSVTGGRERYTLTTGGISDGGLAGDAALATGLGVAGSGLLTLGAAALVAIDKRFGSRKWAWPGP